VNVDGSAAAVLMSEKKAKELGLMKRAVRIKASVLDEHPWQERDLVMRRPLHAARGQEGLRDGGLRPERHQPGRAARLLRDGRAPALRELGLCKDGEAGQMIDSGGRHSAARCR